MNQGSGLRALLQRRTAAVAAVRSFFAARDVLEVDVPVLQGGANLDHGVVPMAVETGRGRRFLPTSPEHPLKRLVAAGAGAVWALSPAFRHGEHGRRHSPEFRMLEWYRPGLDDAALANEVVALCQLVTGLDGPTTVLPWREAYRTFVGLDPASADDAAVIAACGPDATAVAGDRGAALDLLMATRIEPRLGLGEWTVLTDYPASGCAQARLRHDQDGWPVAARFEVYRNGLELANGYHEVTAANELAGRFQLELDQRQDPRLVMDQGLLAALANGFPDCAGVAVGFDRLLMLAWGVEDIAQVQAIPFAEA